MSYGTVFLSKKKVIPYLSCDISTGLQAEEEKEYFNVEINLRLKKLKEFYEAGVRKIFCGHYHR
jgi:hypothetical protein